MLILHRNNLLLHKHNILKNRKLDLSSVRRSEQANKTKLLKSLKKLVVEDRLPEKRRVRESNQEIVNRMKEEDQKRVIAKNRTTISK